MTTTAEVPVLHTRKPTGKPPWPMILLAGVEKSGKSYSAAAFSASDLIDRTFFVELGEGYADHYGSMPGARYEIVEHDGTYLGIGRALRAATLQPRPNGKPHAIVLDTATELWDLLSEEAQATANRRKKKDADGEAQITMDLWNTAKKRWRHIVDLLRQYDGPVIITARLEQVAVVDKDGRPTTAKEWKVRAEKNLPFECDAVVKMPAQGTAILTGVRSLLLRTGSGLEVSDFSVEKLLTSMGIRPGETQARSYTAPKAEAQPEPEPELTVDQAAAKMRRNHPSGPTEDDWTTDPGEPPAEPVSTDAQRQKIALLIQDKRGVKTSDRGSQRAVAAGMLGHPVRSFTDLTRAQASALIETLTALPDYVADAEAVEGTGEQVSSEPFVDGALSVLVSDAAHKNVAVAMLLDLQVQGAETKGELGRLFEIAVKARDQGHISAEDFADLDRLGSAAYQALENGRSRPASGWSHQMLAQMAGAES